MTGSMPKHVWKKRNPCMRHRRAAISDFPLKKSTCKPIRIRLIRNAMLLASLGNQCSLEHFGCDRGFGGHVKSSLDTLASIGIDVGIAMLDKQFHLECPTGKCVCGIGRHTHHLAAIPVQSPYANTHGRAGWSNPCAKSCREKYAAIRARWVTLRTTISRERLNAVLVPRAGLSASADSAICRPPRPSCRGPIQSVFRAPTQWPVTRFQFAAGVTRLGAARCARRRLRIENRRRRTGRSGRSRSGRSRQWY